MIDRRDIAHAFLAILCLAMVGAAAQAEQPSPTSLRIQRRQHQVPRRNPKPLNRTPGQPLRRSIVLKSPDA